MYRLYFLLAGILILSTCASAQEPARDTIKHRSEELKLEEDEDDLDDLDELMSDLDAFLDSLLRPRSSLLINLSMSRGYYNYKRTATTRIQTIAANTYSPTIAYYHKSGLGLTATGFIVNDDDRLNPYQFSLTPAYDFVQKPAFATGISYTRYFSKDSLAFYVSPLQNEISTYFTYRKSWLRPSLSLGYAWGTRKELQERLAFIQSLRIRRRLLNLLQSYQDVNDFSATVSVLHDFYWLHVLSPKDKIRITPQFIFSSGTQQYGFNQRGNNYIVGKLTRQNLLSTAREFSLDSRKEFRPLSLGFSLRTEYSFGKCYVQPQLLLDYYFPAETDNFSTLFSLNAGVYF